jgi:hypothetical protein
VAQGRYARRIPADCFGDHARPERAEHDGWVALHTVTVCDLAAEDLKCEDGSPCAPGRVFYVSPDAVYVWTTDRRAVEKDAERSLLYRTPLDGSASAIKINGSPVDQFAFHPNEHKRLHVLGRSESSGDLMWAAKGAAGDVALMRISLQSFNDGSNSVSSWDYHGLPKPSGYTFQNRFVGDYLLYGTGSGWGAHEKKKQANLFAVRWADGDLSRLSVARRRSN